MSLFVQKSFLCIVEKRSCKFLPKATEEVEENFELLAECLNYHIVIAPEKIYKFQQKWKIK